MLQTEFLEGGLKLGLASVWKCGGTRQQRLSWQKHQTRLYLCIRTQKKRSNIHRWSLCAGACFYQGFLPSNRKRETELTSKKCGNAPGDPASLLLDQREEFSKDCF